jgi:hypothetical protein
VIVAFLVIVAVDVVLLGTILAWQLGTCTPCPECHEAPGDRERWRLLVLGRAVCRRCERSYFRWEAAGRPR